jgi:hypothetical protein
MPPSKAYEIIKIRTPGSTARRGRQSQESRIAAPTRVGNFQGLHHLSHQKVMIKSDGPKYLDGSDVSDRHRDWGQLHRVELHLRKSRLKRRGLRSLEGFFHVGDQPAPEMLAGGHESFLTLDVSP